MGNTEIKEELKEVKEELKKEKEKNKALKKLRNIERGFFKDFKLFISKGNVVQLAVAFIMGVAFTAIVNSLVDDIFMPLVSILFGKSDIGSWKWIVSSELTINYGRFIMAVVNFLLVALILFFIIKIWASAEAGFKKLKKGQTPPPPPPPAEKMEDILKDIRKLLQENNKKDK